MFWVIWDIFSVYNLLSLAWLLLYGVVFVLVGTPFFIMFVLGAPKRRAAAAKSQAFYREKNRQLDLERERLFRPAKP